MHWDLVLVTVVGWVFVTGILAVAMYLYVTVRTGWLRRFWNRVVRGLALLVGRVRRGVRRNRVMEK
jgi:hypothetical protein